MRTEWEFYVEAREMTIIEERKFRTEARRRDTGETVQCEVLIKPYKFHAPTADDTGKIVVAVPVAPEASEDLATAIALQFAERLSFPIGKLSITGPVFATRIPESAAEAAAIGDAPCMVRFSFVEAPDYEEPDYSRLAGPVTQRGLALLRQFNVAKELNTPVERFLAMFKVIEKAYADSRSLSLLTALRQDVALASLVTAVVPSAPHDQTLKEWVRLRDNCAHLRGATGYVPGDQRVFEDLIPALRNVEAVAERCVEQAMTASD